MSKVAIVTGGARGIGEGIVLKLAEVGYNVTINYVSDRSVSKTAELVARIKEEYGVECMGFRADVSDYEACKEMAKATVEKFGRIDVLVNNAGDCDAKEFLSMTPEGYRRIMDVDLFGSFNTCHNVIPYMLEVGGGCIVNISSTAGSQGYPANSDYCASKSGLHGFTRALAAEFADRNIRVNAVAPGMVITDLVRKSSEWNEKYSPLDEMIKTIPLKRFGQPEDIALAVEFLTRETYMTGCILNVNGGVLMD